MNNILVIIDGHDEKKVFSFSPNLTEQECFDKIKHSMESGVKSKFFFENSEISAKTYEEFYVYKNGNIVFNERLFLETKVTERIRQQRDMLLGRLDVPFMMSLESDNERLKNHIINLKNFLRDVPNNLELRKIESNEDLVRFTPFQNIFTAVIVDAGSGYEKPPQIVIEYPKNEMYFGRQAKVTATIKDGSVSNLFVTNNGCGYLTQPSVAVSKPEDPNGKTAIIASGPIENAITYSN